MMARLTAEELAEWTRRARTHWYQPSACEIILRMADEHTKIASELDEVRRHHANREQNLAFAFKEGRAAGFEEAREVVIERVRTATKRRDIGGREAVRLIDEIRQLKPGGGETKT